MLMTARRNTLKIFETFEAYCKARWDMSKMHAYRLIGSAQVVDAVSPIGIQSPGNERQTRPLSRLEPDQQREAWQKARGCLQGLERVGSRNPCGCHSRNVRANSQK